MDRVQDAGLQDHEESRESDTTKGRGFKAVGEQQETLNRDSQQPGMAQVPLSPAAWETGTAKWEV